MISMKELNPAGDQAATQEQLDNMKVLLERVNKIRAAWGKPMTVTSGLRTMADHIRIYKDKAAKKQAPFLDGVYDEKKVPMKSKHLLGQAIDIADPGLKITAWLKADPKLLEDAQLWCEEGNTNWVHFQILPPKSGRRWFLP